MDRTTVSAAVMAALLATACGASDAATDAAATAPTGQATAAEQEASTIAVTAVDYGFEGVPGGAWSLSEPGRYVLVCMIPQRADPAAFRAATASGTEAAPDTEGGPPHAALGMVAEITVR